MVIEFIAENHVPLILKEAPSIVSELLSSQGEGIILDILPVTTKVMLSVCKLNIVLLKYTAGFKLQHPFEQVVFNPFSLKVYHNFYWLN